MVIHITSGRNGPKKKGLFYFLCCGCGIEEEAEQSFKPKGLAERPYKSSATNQPNSRPIHPKAPARPSPPPYSNNQQVTVQDRRKRFEDLNKTHPSRPPISFGYPPSRIYSNEVVDARSFFERSLEGDDEIRETGIPKRPSAVLSHDDEKKYENRATFTSIFKNAPLYQIYDERFKRRESRRLRHRLRESLRSLRKKRADPRSANPPLSTHSSSPFTPDDASSSSSSSDDGSPTKTPSFTVIKRETRRKMSDVTRMTKAGEMSHIANEFTGTGPSRARWVDMPEVIKQRLAEGMTKEQRSLQEARFEILTSEASYYKSLTVLIDLFYKSPVFNPTAPNAVVTEFDKHQLFSNILNIHVTSENLLHSLESTFRQDPMMESMCDILYEHSETKLSYYVAYVKNQMYQTRTLSRLLNCPAFKEAVMNIQTMPQCSSLDLNSFLVLPMQRVMRLRLLVAAVLHYTPRSSAAYESGLVALASLEKLISECNTQKGHMEQKERLVTLSMQLEFKSSLKVIATGSRELVKEGNLRLMVSSNLPNAPFKRKFSDGLKNKPIQITLFLFTDVLLIAKRKGEKYLVDDIGNIEDLAVTIEANHEDAQIKRTVLRTKQNADDPFHIVANIQPSRSVSIRQSREFELPNQVGRLHRDRSRSKGGSGRFSSATNSSNNTETCSGNTACYPFILTFTSTDLSIVDYHFVCDSLSLRERWVDALQPGYYQVPKEISYDTWDCPQVIATISYGATERDELDVKEGDLMNVIVELSDGWLKGVLPDGREGWVPTTICQYVEDPQARRQNMKNFLLSEDAQRAYQMKKKLEHQKGLFARVQDVRNTPI